MAKGNRMILYCHTENPRLQSTYQNLIQSTREEKTNESRLANKIRNHVPGDTPKARGRPCEATTPRVVRVT